MTCHWVMCVCAALATSFAHAANTEFARSGQHDMVVPLFGDVSAMPQQGKALIRSSTTYVSSSTGAVRPMLGNQVSENAVLEWSGWVGLGRDFALTLHGMNDQMYLDSSTHSASMLGVGWSPLLGRHHRVAFSVGYMREFAGTSGLWSRVVAEVRSNRFVISATGHGERVFAAGRDAIDIVVTTGCYYQLSPAFRFGGEYVGQDLEGWFEPGEAEGMRQFAGPVVAVNEPESGLNAIAGPAWGVFGTSSFVVTRVAAVVAF